MKRGRRHDQHEPLATLKTFANLGYKAAGRDAQGVYPDVRPSRCKVGHESSSEGIFLEAMVVTHEHAHLIWHDCFLRRICSYCLPKCRSCS